MSFRSSLKIARKSVRQMHKCGFLSKISHVKVYFFKFIGFLTVSCIQGCFHWLSSPILSGVMDNHNFMGNCIGPRGLKGRAGFK